MSTVLTLVASDPQHPLTDKHLKEITKMVGFYNVQPTCQPVWLKPKTVAEIGINQSGGHSMMRHLWDFLHDDKIDIFITPIEGRRKKILLADMDSTIVTGETLDDLAAHAGIKDQVAEITARAMNGELNFHAALEERVGLLKNLPTRALKETLDEIQINPGAAQMIKTMRENGTHCVLVSGGFTYFTGFIAQHLQFMNHHGNVLDIQDDALTGKVIPPILDKNSKVEFLRHYMEMYKLGPESCMTIGDGANDLPMLKMAGFGVGYKAKETVAQEVENLIIHGDFTAALYAQGYGDEDILAA